MAPRRTPGSSRSPAHDGLAAAVFQLFPHGIVVLDSNGAVVQANSEGRRFLRVESDAALREATCCELLGCHGVGALAGFCITEAVMLHGERPPEVRVDLPSGEGAVWVTAARLGSQPRVVLELRPGDRGDRRRRTKPHWSGRPEVRISALGRMRVWSREGPMGGAWLEQRPGQILKLLVCERHRVLPADAIAAAIWPARGARAVANVRQGVHELREWLEPGRSRHGHSSFVESRQGGYVLQRGRVRIDADDFERRVQTGLTSFGTGDHEAAERDLRAGVGLYEGDLLADDPYADWAMAERERLRDVLVRAMRVLAELALRDGRLAAAASDLRRLAEVDPYDVAVERRLIEIFLREGRRGEAHRRYAALRHRMLRDLGETPPFDLAELADSAPVQLRLA